MFLDTRQRARLYPTTLCTAYARDCPESYAKSSAPPEQETAEHLPVTREMENLYYTVPADRIYVWVPTTKRQWENNRKNATLAFDEPLYDHGGKIACVPLGLHHQEYKNKTKKHIFS